MEIHGYKVLNPDYTCRDVKYSVPGRFYEDYAEICRNGIHFCPNLADCFNYYDMDKENHVVEVIGRGEFDQDSYGEKVCCTDLLIIRELSWEEVLAKANIGKQNHGRYNRGHFNYGDGNGGNRNIGNENSGNNNYGDRNTGDDNMGSRNSGDKNIGNGNSGDFNVGNYNSGCFCVGDYLYGYCCYSPETIVGKGQKLLFNRLVTSDEFWQYLGEYDRAINSVFNDLRNAVEAGMAIDDDYWTTIVPVSWFTSNSLFDKEIFGKIVKTYAESYAKELKAETYRKMRILEIR